ncbi:MAG: SPOR domain-containing protein [Nitrospiraceae bacterium]|nr:SPOR domain-containing protein [Nitrospiraceae bacterium]
MMENEKGSILSKVFIIPAGVVVIIGVFLLGFYMGKRQERPAPTEKPSALPDVMSEYLPKKDDLTFYKTLTEKGEKSVSVDLKPKPKDDPAPAAGTNPEEKKEMKPVAEKPSKKEEPKAAPAKPSKPQPAAQTAKAEPAPKGASSKLRYTIQVGSYPDRAQAEEEVRGMKRRGYAAVLAATNIAGKGIWYRVRVGSFASRPPAEKLAQELKSKEGISAFITTE